MAYSSIAYHTEQVLEWRVLLDFLAKEAASSMGAEYCRTLTSASEFQAACLQQQETTDMVHLLQGAHPLPPLTFPDVRHALIRAGKGGIIEGPDLRDISLVLGLSQTAKHLLQNQSSTFSTIGVRAQDLQEIIWVKQTLESCIDLNGHLRETASPELHQLTQKSHHLRHSMRRRLEQMLVSQQYEDLLQGQYFAERENRYVLPVKAERKHEIDGIVHDISSSGATVFVEPRLLIELNNSIKFADLQVDQEARHILQDLSSLVSEHVPIIQKNLDCLAVLDCLMAKARLSMKIHGSPIRLNQDSTITLHQACHPLLVLTKDHVVPNSIRLEGGTHVLIISGPNAGGKTVSLKLVGLFAMMVKAGLHPSCGPGSGMAFFEQVYADIGDSQDLSRDISSFSGHILKMIELLTAVKSTNGISSRHSLVLLDEVGSSTDPVEGAALAEALLDHLSELGCIIVATTHYPSLKTLAHHHSHIRNASQEFDIDTLSPTYRLIDGIPGGSSALEIAKRLGLDHEIIQKAQSLIRRPDRDLDHLFQSLHETRARLEKEVTQTQHLREEAQRLHQEAQAAKNFLQAQEREDRQRYRKQWQREFSKAQRQLNHLLDEAKKNQHFSTRQSIQRTARSINQEMMERLPTPSTETITPLHEGDLVEIDSLGTTGILLENPEGKKQVSIRAGVQTIKTAPSALRAVLPAPPVTTSQVQPRQEGRPPPLTFQHSPGSGIFSPAAGHSLQTLDIRGVRLDDAIDLVEAALDQALIHHVKNFKIVHGHGSGRLKSAIRKYCQTSSYIKSYRAGDSTEGGDGVTVIELG